MSVCIVDTETAGRLCRAGQSIEVRDESGQVLGQFIPEAHKSLWALEPQINDDEIERRKRGGQSLPVDQVEKMVDDLEKRP